MRTPALLLLLLCAACGPEGSDVPANVEPPPAPEVVKADVCFVPGFASVTGQDGPVDCEAARHNLNAAVQFLADRGFVKADTSFKELHLVVRNKECLRGTMENYSGCLLGLYAPQGKKLISARSGVAIAHEILHFLDPNVATYGSGDPHPGWTESGRWDAGNDFRDSGIPRDMVP